MCLGIEIMNGDRVVGRADSVREAVVLFGTDHMRWTPLEAPDDGEPPPIDFDADHCLCPIDTDYLIEASGYRKIDMSDPRWSPIDTRVERAT